MIYLTKTVSLQEDFFLKPLSPLQFDYGSVTERYCSKNWIGRKVMALPRAAWWGVVMTTYYLFQAAVVGFLKKSFDKERYFRASYFCAARSLQCAFGHLISLLDDRWGNHYIQTSTFHILCYRFVLTNKLFSNNKNILDSPTSHNKLRFLPLLANIYFVKGEGMQALKTIEGLSPKNSEMFIKHMVSSYFEEGNLDRSIEIICAMKNTMFAITIMKSLCNNVQKHSLLQKQEILRSVPDTIAYREKIQIDFIRKAIAKYIDMDRLEEALQMIRNISLNSIEQQGNFMVTVAEAYLKANNSGDALKVVEQINMHSNVKELFLVKLAQYYFKKNSVHQEIILIKLVKNICFRKIMESNGESAAAETNFEGYCAKYEDKGFNDKLNKNFRRLSSSCSQKIQEDFSQNSTAEAILEKIRTECAPYSSVEGLLSYPA